MLRHIIYKDILDYLLNSRIALSLILVVSLYVASGLIFVARYQQQYEDYWDQTNRNLAAVRENSERLYKLALNKQVIWRRPNVLTLCVEGFEKSLPDCYRFDIFTADLPEVMGRSSVLYPSFRDIDWCFIVTFVLSFVALILTYDSICGEREAGTLRLILAGSVPRYKVLLSKYVSVMFVLGIPLLLGLALSLAIVTSSLGVDVGAGDWLRILGIVLLSYLYLSVFVLLGIFVSSRSSHSTSSMVILLFLWVGLAILIPGLGRIVSDKSQEIDVKIPTYAKIRPDSITSAAMRDMQSRRLKEHVWAMIAQAETGRLLTSITPTVIHQRASEAIAGTGIHRCTGLYQQIIEYQEGLKEYIRANDAEDTDSRHRIFREDPFSLYLILTDETYIDSWRAISKKPVDFDSVPKFQERDLALGQSLKLAIWDIGLLVLFNLVFFTAAFVSFLRYDVR